jgi:type II secretion system protein H
MRAPILSARCARRRPEGFSIVELMIVLVIVGLIVTFSYPTIQRALEKRSLESAAREIMATLQRAKLEAIKSGLNSRVKFEKKHNEWFYYMEKENSSGDWSQVSGFLKKSIPADLNVDMKLKNDIAEFTPLGLVANYEANKNTISIDNPSLKGPNQDDKRVITLYEGGAVHYQKAQSKGK